MDFLRKFLAKDTLAPEELVGNSTSFEPDLEEAMRKVRRVQKLGFDVGFAFLPTHPDAPHLHLCVGRYEKSAGLGCGFDIHSRGLALAKTLSETIERGLWQEHTTYWHENSILDSSNNLGDTALSLKNLAGFSSETRNRFRKLAYSPETIFRWSRGVQLDSMRQLFIPSQLVSARYAMNTQDNDERLLREPNTNGLAVADTFEEAAHRGLLELIERDAFMITYFNMIRPQRINLRTIENSAIQSLVEQFELYDLTCDIVLLPTDLPVHVICALVRDHRGGPALVVSAKANYVIEYAIHGAMMEGLATWTLARSSGAYRRPISLEKMSISERVGYWAKPDNAEKLSWLWNGDLIPAPKSVPALNLRSLAHALKRNGYAAAAIEMSPPLLQEMNIHAVAVVSPELQPLSMQPDTLYDGGARLESVPKKFGFTPRRNTPIASHPFP